MRLKEANTTFFLLTIWLITERFLVLLIKSCSELPFSLIASCELLAGKEKSLTDPHKIVRSLLDCRLVATYFRNKNSTVSATSASFICDFHKEGSWFSHLGILQACARTYHGYWCKYSKISMSLGASYLTWILYWNISLNIVFIWIYFQ